MDNFCDFTQEMIDHVKRLNDRADQCAFMQLCLDGKKVETLLHIFYYLLYVDTIPQNNDDILKETFRLFISEFGITNEILVTDILFSLAQQKNDLLKAYQQEIKDKSASILEKETALHEAEKKAKELLSDLQKRRKHSHGKGKIKKAYEHFKSMRGDDTPCFRTFNTWCKGKCPYSDFPGIDDEIKFIQWVRVWDAPERKKAGRSIGGMSEEEIYKKRKI